MPKNTFSATSFLWDKNKSKETETSSFRSHDSLTSIPEDNNNNNNSNDNNNDNKESDQHNLRNRFFYLLFPSNDGRNIIKKRGPFKSLAAISKESSELHTYSHNDDEGLFSDFQNKLFNWTDSATATLYNLITFSCCKKTKTETNTTPKLTRKTNEKVLQGVDLLLQSRALLSEKGYPIIEHEVVTKDGYINLMIRIPRRESRKVIFLQAGSK